MNEPIFSSLTSKGCPDPCPAGQDYYYNGDGGSAENCISFYQGIGYSAQAAQDLCCTCTDIA